VHLPATLRQPAVAGIYRGSPAGIEPGEIVERRFRFGKSRLETCWKWQYLPESRLRMTAGGFRLQWIIQ
jgi:hypothetical protein